MACSKYNRFVKVNEPFDVQNHSISLYIPETLKDIKILISVDGVNYEVLPDKTKVSGDPSNGGQNFVINNIPHHILMKVEASKVEATKVNADDTNEPLIELIV